MSAIWRTSCLDWEDRLLSGRPLVPDLPLFEDQAARALRIFNRLKLPDVHGTPSLGDATGEWFKAIVAALFGSYDVITRHRMIQEVFLLVPKKNSKSTGAAGIMVTAIIINERPEAEFLLVAPTKKIADIAFGQASKMIDIDPELKRLFRPQQNIRTITHRLTGAVLQIKAADTDVVTGGIATATLIDETHVFSKKAKAAEIFLEIRGALTSRPDGFLFQITTQSKAPPSGVFASELKTARAVRDGRITLPMLPILYELPLHLSQKDGWQNPKYWGLVNPNLGKSVQLSFLQNQLKKAISEGPDKVALFASQHHNVEVGLALQTDQWAGAKHWEAAGTEPKLALEALLARCEVAVVTIDGGGLDDLLGLVVEGREIGTGKRLAWCKAWVHKSVIEEAEKRESVENGDDEDLDADDEEEKPKKNGSYRPQNVQLLKDFAADGDLVIVETMGDDIKEVADIVEQVEASGILAEKYAIGVDKAGIGQIVVAIVGRGIEEQRIVSVPQGWELSGAIKTLERELVAGEFAHAGSAMMAWCVGNAKAEPKGNAIAITKATAGKAKIDPLVALFMATALMTKNPELRRSIYENDEAYRKAFGKDPAEDEGEIKPWSPEILKDPRHPDFAEHKKRFEAWRDAQPDED